MYQNPMLQLRNQVATLVTDVKDIQKILTDYGIGSSEENKIEDRVRPMIEDMIEANSIKLKSQFRDDVKKERHLLDIAMTYKCEHAIMQAIRDKFELVTKRCDNMNEKIEELFTIASSSKNPDNEDGEGSTEEQGKVMMEAMEKSCGVYAHSEVSALRDNLLERVNHRIDVGMERAMADVMARVDARLEALSNNQTTLSTVMIAGSSSNQDKDMKMEVDVEGLEGQCEGGDDQRKGEEEQKMYPDVADVVVGGQEHENEQIRQQEEERGRDEERNTGGDEESDIGIDNKNSTYKSSNGRKSSVKPKTVRARKNATLRL